MSHRAQVVVVRKRRATVFVDRWMGARVLDALAEGPEGCEAVTELLEPAAADETGFEAGWLADFDAKVLVAFGDPTTSYVGEEPDPRIASDLAAWKGLVLPRWSGFSVTWADGEDALASYLEGRARVEGVTEADLDALRRRLDALLEPVGERSDALDAEERACEDVRTADVAASERRPGEWVIKPALLLLLPVALLVRVLSIPLRARLRARAARRLLASRAAALREAIARAEALAKDPDDVGARFARGLALLSVGRNLHAERDFDVCVERLEGATGHSADGVSLAVALFNRGASRRRLRLPKVGARDKARAAALGMKARPGGVRSLLAPLGWSFLIVAGLTPSE